MERVLKYLQSTSEATMNVICGIIILISMRIFVIFEFHCPCIPGYNKIYALGVMFFPPLVFFLIGVLVNKYTIMILEEMARPSGGREKNKDITKRFLISMLLRALAPPIMWIIISLLDGKFIVCAFSESVDPEPFWGLSNSTGIDVAQLLAKIPCKDMELLRNATSRKAAARFLKFLSQALGWSLVLFFIFLGALARLLGPLFTSTESIQARYWACYTDLEEKFFEEACIKQNHSFAKKYMKHFFESFGKPRMKSDNDSKKAMEFLAEKENFCTTPYPDHLMGILETWYNCKPPVSIRSHNTPAQNKTHAPSCGKDFVDKVA
ncbi:calcium homeostasis modulator protein 3-like [Lissotriton helveticus]